MTNNRVSGKRPTKEREAHDESIFDIDMNALDDAWIEQPKLFFAYSSKLADAKLDLDEEKAKLDVINADLDRSIREDPEAYGLSKVTEASVKNAIPDQQEFILQQKRIRKARHRLDILSAFVNALEHRKRTLENLVTLHGQSYFATPRSKGNEMDEAVKSNVRRKQRTRN